jgi:DNA-binding PadR family transcriptional regulator
VRNSKTYAVTDEGLAEVRRWLRETEPDRRVRSEAALRTFFLWLLEPGEARGELERERAYWSERLEELEAIKARPRGPGRKEQAFGIALEGGIRSLETRLQWLGWAARELENNPQ